MDLNADLTLRATRVSVDVEDGIRHVGFAEGDEDEPYVLFSQPVRGGPVRLELNDPLFAAENAVARLTLSPEAVEIRIEPACTADLGFARHVVIRPAGGVTGWDDACAALTRLLGDVAHRASADPAGDPVAD